MRPKLHPEARLEVKEAKAFYRRRSPLTAVAFTQEIGAAIARIAEAPLRYPAGEHGTREHVLPWRFPFTIVYRIREDVVVIVAVAHHSREPEYWQARR